MPKDFYRWDSHSDQPHIIRDKSFKRKLYLKGLFGSAKTLLASFYLPFIALRQTARSKTNHKIDCIGLCVNIDTPLPEKAAISISDLQLYVTELGVDNLLVRVPLSALEKLEQYIELVEQFADKNLLINILQDRRHIDSEALLHRSLKTIFTRLSTFTTQFQISNSVNRRKWAFISMDEYFRFFRIAQQVRDQHFPQLTLLGGNIIDFELPNFARSVFHRYPIKYDGVAVQLYVDRRGAPENKQLGCDLLGKIDWFDALIKRSKKTADQLWITETNWPLKGTEPFAPAVGDCMVNEDQQAAYLARYFLLAIASGKVHKCYWHQLVAPGYGLIDNRGKEKRKRKAFLAFKTLNALFSGATVQSFEEQQNSYYKLVTENNKGLVMAIWTNDMALTIKLSSIAENPVTILDLTGRQLNVQEDQLRISGDVIYLLSYAYE